MPRAIDGTFTLVAGNPVVAGTTIQSVWANATLSDLAAGLTDSLSRSGLGGMTAPFSNADGTMLAPGMTWANEPTSGWYRQANQVFRYSVGNEDIFQINKTGITLPSGKTGTFNGVITLVGGTTVGWGGGAHFENTALGLDALPFNTTGIYNTAIGYAAGLNIIAGSDSNTAVGALALGQISISKSLTGDGNTAVGYGALFNATGIANSNTAVGGHALEKVDTAGSHTAIGYNAGATVTVGTAGVYIGVNAGSVSTGTANTFVGGFSGNVMTTGTKNTFLGAYDGNSGGLDLRTSSNNIVLSDGDGVVRMRIDSAGAVGIGIAAPTQLLHVYSTASAGATSLTESTNTAAATTVQAKTGTITTSMYSFGSTFTPVGGFKASAGAVATPGSGGLALVASNAAGDIRLYTGGSAIANNYMTILSTGDVIVNRNLTVAYDALPAAPGGYEVMQRWSGTDAGFPLLLSDGFGGSGSRIIGRIARGTPGAITPILANDNFFAVSGIGCHTNATYGTGTRIAMIEMADENWSSTQQGTRFEFWTTANGGTVFAKALTIGNDKSITVNGSVTVNQNAVAASALPAISGSYTLGMRLASSDATNNIFLLDGFGAGSYSLVGRAATGTAAAPTPITANAGLFTIGGQGCHTNGTYTTTNRAQIRFAATENWNAGANGTQIQFTTTANGTATAGTALIIDQDKSITVNQNAVAISALPAISGSYTLGMRLASADGANAIVLYDGFGGGGHSLVGRGSNGTAAAPTATTTFNGLFAIGAQGCTSAGTFTSTNRAQIRFAATENWNAGATGTQMQFTTTANGTATAGSALIIDQDKSITVAGSVAIPAGGTTGIGVKVSSTANFGVFFGSGAPSLSAAKGSLYLRSDGTTTNDRAYINTNGTNGWTAVTTAT